MILTVLQRGNGLMNSLEGYNTNGHEYRVSQIDRSNSRRLKWMMNEARDIVNKQDAEKK